MQIKRFEGSDMTETLRLVKEEFGDNAVILSAKQIRPGGFLKGMRKTCVEVTAAIDKEPNQEKKDDPFSSVLSKQLDDSLTEDRVTLTSNCPYGVPKTEENDFSTRQTHRREREKHHIKTDVEKSIPQKEKDRFSSNGTVKENGSKHCSVSSRKSFFSAGTSHSIARPFYRLVDRQKRIAVIGACGAGKSSCLAKLALYCKTVEKLKVAMISLDRFSIGANSLVETVCRMMDLPFSVVFDDRQLHRTIDNLPDTDVILIDTPGLSNVDETKKQAVAKLLSLLVAEEIHWVANATIRKENHLADAQRFVAMGATHLLFTRMEEAVEENSLLDLMNVVDLPLGFYSDGTDLFDDLKEADLNWMSERDELKKINSNLIGGKVHKARERHRPQLIENDSAVEKTSTTKDSSVVVNGNSELFHEPGCILVKNFDHETIKVLNSMETALEMGLKPCHVCSRSLSRQKDDQQTFIARHANAT